MAIALLAWPLLFGPLAPAARNDMLAMNAALALGCAVSTGFAWWYGRLSDEGKAQQLVHGEHFDHPVDVAWLPASEKRTLIAQFQDYLAKNQAPLVTPENRKHVERKLWALRFTSMRLQTEWVRPGRLSVESRAIWDEIRKRYPDYVDSAKTL